MIFYDSVSVPTKGSVGWEDAEQVSFGGKARNVYVHFVSGTGPVEISFTGQELHGEIGAGKPDDLIMNNVTVSEIFIQSANGDEVIQAWAWGD